MSNKNQREFFDRLKTNNTKFETQTDSEAFWQSERTADAGQSAFSASSRQSNGNKKIKTKADKKLKTTGLIIAALFVISCFFLPTSPSVDSSEAAKLALENRMSTELDIGVCISSQDEYLSAEDLTITHSSTLSENKIYVWDYASEDGDYVQILVDGVAICDPFMIKHKPVEFTVPTTGEIQVLGIRDGGGGITYAIHYDVNGTTYFNGTNIGEGNLYTLIRE